MSDGWFYTHLGETCGPVGADTLNELAEGGDLDPTDLIWRAGEGPADAAEAGRVLIFFVAGGKPRPRSAGAQPPGRAAPARGPVPPWLGELADAGAGGAAPGAGSPVGPVDWLQDVRRAEQKPPRRP